MPGVVASRLRRLLRPAWLLGARRTTPLSDAWGWDRGTPVDRYYIDQFLDRNREDIRGRVLEVHDSRYTERFGSGVERADVLDVDSSNPRATLVADLAAADGLPADAFDCFILTQTLQFVYDVAAAARNVYRVLAPGGVLLCTVPSVSRVSRRTLESEYWRFTPAACVRLFGDVFGRDAVRVESLGNVFAASAFLYGLAWEELSRRRLEAQDPHFPVVVAVRAVKTERASPRGGEA